MNKKAEIYAAVNGGFAVTSAEGDGIMIANTVAELKEVVGQLFGGEKEKSAIPVTPIAPMPPSPVAPVAGPPPAPRVTPITPSPVAPSVKVKIAHSNHALSIAPSPVAPSVKGDIPSQFGPEYDAEIQRILDSNDRKTAHARLDVLVSAGVIPEYNNRNRIDKLVVTLKEGDRLAAKADTGGEDAPAAPATLEEVVYALQSFASAKGSEKAYAILTSHGCEKISELDEAHWADVIAEAKAGLSEGSA